MKNARNMSQSSKNNCSIMSGQTQSQQASSPGSFNIIGLKKQSILNSDLDEHLIFFALSLLRSALIDSMHLGKSWLFIAPALVGLGEKIIRANVEKKKDCEQIIKLSNILVRRTATLDETNAKYVIGKFIKSQRKQIIIRQIVGIIFIDGQIRK
ncbi:MAG: hypothetical protein EZS28_008819 [Streblomastix strix]|uniref:Uncharacterized protein n=1 Tax=Streblomastix strix TaxID=222440 RepID=A0A5J4WKT3_9EUKA|nr:MAG: hypothetical protein EZS28_008819 [Streblomastix strix]